MELFRGDTFYKSVTAGDYIFQPDDILRVAIFNNTLDETKLYENEIKVTEETSSILVEIPASKTKELKPGILVLELELTYSGVVKTEQFELLVKADGIYE